MQKSTRPLVKPKKLLRGISRDRHHYTMTLNAFARNWEQMFCMLSSDGTGLSSRAVKTWRSSPTHCVWWLVRLRENPLLDLRNFEVVFRNLMLRNFSHPCHPTKNWGIGECLVLPDWSKIQCRSPETDGAKKVMKQNPYTQESKTIVVKVFLAFSVSCGLAATYARAYSVSSFSWMEPMLFSLAIVFTLAIKLFSGCYIAVDTCGHWV